MKQIKLLVFLPPFLLMLGGVLLSYYEPDRFARNMTGSFYWVRNNFSWLFCLTLVTMVFLCAVAAMSPFGRVIIGGPQAKPLLSKWRWFTIILCTCIAIGILMWGAAQPIIFFCEPPESKGIEPESPDAARLSLSYTLLLWTWTPYSINTLLGLMFAFGYYNMKRPFSLGASLSPMLGRGGKWTGQIIDAICLFALVAGVSGSLGGAILMISGGLDHLWGVKAFMLDEAGEIVKAKEAFVLGMITLALAGLFTLSAATGLMKGIRFLSHINTIMLIVLVFFLFVCGPMAFILNASVEAFGHMLSHYFEDILFIGAIQQDSWAKDWLIFSWANCFAWGPISAVFLGRIAYGRSVRAFIAFNLLLPALFTSFWMCVFGGSALHIELFGNGGLVTAYKESGVESVAYAFLDCFPLGAVLVPFFLVSCFISFVTAADSNVSAMSGLSSTGISPETPESSTLAKLLWGTILGLVAWVMIVFANLDGIRMLSSLGGLPAMLLAIGVIYCTIKVIMNPRKYDEFKDGYDEVGQPLHIQSEE